MNNGAVNPPIEWSNVPSGTNAFVLMLYDHVDTLMWAVVNIPGNVRALPEGIPNGNDPRSCRRARFTAVSEAMAGSGLRPD